MLLDHLQRRGSWFFENSFSWSLAKFHSCHGPGCHSSFCDAKISRKNNWRFGAKMVDHFPNLHLLKSIYDETWNLGHHGAPHFQIYIEMFNGADEHDKSFVDVLKTKQEGARKELRFINQTRRRHLIILTNRHMSLSTVIGMSPTCASPQL